ncbi:bifunctional SulP family inorganic anion transporter/carbonic anhydrase [Sinomicrobium sp. FJxs]|uniref:Bifunctional SulP family inorganic anion transporter/carbonic anhydrase n=1 Tax=Sinomicrobium weinanense TaxID=2842200 RepID=A0A926Q3S6_9FLAO|nr:bifunctional SulP family inorganic anion transporter/carbonic anhydrase [Sinomicrobium weinanense]
MFSQLDKDIPAGVVLFLVALPLCLGIALASGAPLISGLISGVIGGLLIGVVSKSGTSVSGPAASVSAVVFLAIQDLGGFDIFLTALVIAGLFQLLFGILRAGLIADYIPTSIIKGLLAAIGIILILSQLKYAVGMELDHSRFSSFSEDYLENTWKMVTLFFQSFTPGSIILTLLSLFTLLFWDKTPLKNFKLFPPALVVVIMGVLLNFLFKYFIPGLYLDSHHLVNIPKVESLSSLITTPDFGVIGHMEIWTTAITIAVIASLSTLLNIEATDNIDPHKRKTPPNRELIAQGIGNTLSGLIGGIAITSVVVRSSVNIESGGQTKLVTILHGILLLLSVLFISSVINLIPLASLSAILLVVGYKLASVSLFRKMYAKGWSQFIPFVITIIAILLTDVLIGVLIGSALSVFFLLRNNYYNPFFIENTKLIQGEAIKLELSNEVSFLNRASIKNTLWNVPDHSKVIIDATFSHYIDLDVVEILRDFENTFAKEHDIDVNIIGLKESYNIGEEIDFVENSIQKEIQKSSPQEILDYLKEGNKNYAKGNLVSRRLRNKELTDFLSSSPLAVVVNCIDLREPLNMLLNTGIGELIPIRAAGNAVSRHIIQSIEIACRNQGARLILLMGNSGNSFVSEAIEAHTTKNPSHLTPLIKDALASETFKNYQENNSPENITDAITRFNLEFSKEKIIRQNTFIREQVITGNIGLASAFYNRKTASVEFSELFSAETIMKK